MGDSGGAFLSDGKRVLNFSSNDYLDLARAPEVRESAETALRKWGCGSTSSRLLVGTFSCHEELESRLARFKGYEDAIAFGSGYLTNVGTVSALVGRHDLVLADRLAHASLLDGAALSRAGVRRFQHNDVDHLSNLLRLKPSRGRCLVITESVFSMDGDLAPLREIAETALSNGAVLLVDEAHATGVWGPGGSGLTGELRLQDRVFADMGTFSKALGAYGGFVAGSATLKRWLVNHARSFIFSTGLPPPCVGAVMGALDILERERGLGAELLRRAGIFRGLLKASGFDTANSASQIIPLIIGENNRTLAFAARLRANGVMAAAVRPPAVPEGTARLRFSVTLAHNEDDLKRAADIVEAVAHETGVL